MLFMFIVFAPADVQNVTVVKLGHITDPDRLFNDLAVDICDKYMELGIELGLQSNVLRKELETGGLQQQQGNKKALRMFELWHKSVAKDDFTYSSLAAALIKQGFKFCAHKHCFTSIGNHIICAC